MSTDPTASTDHAALPVTLEHVRRARVVLDGVARVTPLESSRPLSERVGGPVLLKCENLQRTGSFKMRGAYVRIAGLDEVERARGVVAASAGNHAQGVALSAQLLGAPATVFMPRGAPIPKVEATRGYGAEVRFVGDTVDEALAAAAQHAEETGAVLVPPFDHVDVVAGQGTVGLEILEQCPDVRTVVVPLGGGGLLAGIAVAIKSQRPDVRIIGVQAAGAAAYPKSLSAHRPVPLTDMATMADGIAVGKPGEIPLAIIEELVDEIVTVGEEQLSRGLLLALERTKLVIEPAGAAGIAAILDGTPEEAAARFASPVVVVASGGNIDPIVMVRLLRHGLAAAGRYLVLRVRVGDRPGTLVSILEAIAEADANVVEVEHVRTEPGLGVDEVEVSVQLETRGAAHGDDVVAHLEASGYRVRFRSDRPQTY
jgi:threonine dehydratase